MENSVTYSLGGLINKLGPSTENSSGYKIVVAKASEGTIPASAQTSAKAGVVTFYPSESENGLVIPFNKENLPSFSDPLELIIWSDLNSEQQNLRLWYTFEEKDPSKTWGYFQQYPSSRDFNASEDVGESFGGWDSAGGSESVELTFESDEEGGWLIVGTLEVDPD